MVGSRSSNSIIRNFSPIFQLCVLGCGFIIATGDRSGLQYPFYYSRYQKKERESFFSSSIKIPRDGSDWPACITCTLAWPEKWAHVVGRLSTQEDSLFLKERLLGTRTTARLPIYC